MTSSFSFLYTSSNLSDERVLSYSFEPNRKYNITNANIDHMTNVTTVSGLNTYFIRNITINPTSITTPSDNVGINMELTRDITSNIVSIQVYNFFSGYPNYTYIGTIYKNGTATTATITNLDASTGPTSVVNAFAPNDLPSLTSSNVDVRFRNTTLNIDVFTNTSLSTQTLTVPIHDIRGLAYMRNFTNLTSNIIFSMDVWIPSNGSFINQREVRLSADGNRMVILYYDHKTSQIVINRYVQNSNGWTQYKTSWGRSPGTRFYRTSEISNVFVSDLAFAPYGDTYSYIHDNHIYFKKFDDNLDQGSIDFGRKVHCINISADGKRLVASAHHSTKTPTVTTGGTAKVYYYNESTWQLEGDLSSNRIVDFDDSLFYGSYSEISGDGRTVMVMGFQNDYIWKGFVWKYNNYSDTWVHATILHPHNSGSIFRDYKMADISHDGKVIVVHSAGYIYFYTTDDYTTWTEYKIGKYSIPLYTCDVSGDGNVAVFAKDLDWVELEVYTKNGASWSLVQTVRRTEWPIRSGALSYDGRTYTYLTGTSNPAKLITTRFDKNESNIMVYDYFNINSAFYLFDYSFDYNSIIKYTVNWSSTVQQANIHNYHTSPLKTGYGHWDGTSVSADGRFVLVGAPSDNKAYLYDTKFGNIAHEFSNGSVTDFGMRCAMEDVTKYVAIVGVQYLCVYSRDLANKTFALKQTIDHGYSVNIYSFKMSRNGNVILLSSIQSSVEIKQWETTDGWNTVSSQTLGTGKYVATFDLNYDGSYIVAGESVSATTADLTVFYRSSANSIYSNIYTQLTTASYVFMHSFAISDVATNGTYTILVGGALVDTTNDEFKFRVIKVSTVTPSFSGNTGSDDLVTKSPSVARGRLGRTCSISYNGLYGVISGSQEYDPLTTNLNGGAVLIDLSNNSIVKEFPHITASPEATSGNVNNYEQRYNKYGTGCFISTDNTSILVSGGGYAVLYSVSTEPIIVSFPTEGLMFRLDPTESDNPVISYHPTETVVIDTSLPVSYNTTSDNINGRPIFTGYFSTIPFAYTKREFTVAMVVKISHTSTAFKSWFQYDAGQTNPLGAKDLGFKIEGNGIQPWNPVRFPYTSSIGGQHSNWYTEPQWHVTASLINVPLVFYASYSDTHAMNFRVYDLSGNLIHDGQMLGMYTIQTIMNNLQNPISGTSRARIGTDGYSNANGVFGDLLFYNKRLSASERDNVVDNLLKLYGGGVIQNSFGDERRYPQPTVPNGNRYDLTSISPLQSEYTDLNMRFGTFTINNEGVYTLTTAPAPTTEPDFRYPVLNVFQNFGQFGFTIADVGKMFSFSPILISDLTFDVVVELPRSILFKKLEFLTRYDDINKPAAAFYDFPLFAQISGIEDSGIETILGTRDWDTEYPGIVFDPTGNGQQFYVKNTSYNKDVLVIMNQRYYDDTNRDITMYKKFRIVLYNKHNGLNTRIDGGGLYIFGEEPL